MFNRDSFLYTLNIVTFLQKTYPISSDFVY